MSEKVSLYNPRDTPPEQLEAMLTGREHLVTEVLDSLREQAHSPTRQHWLLRGPRGIGKTHLTGIIHHRVSTDPELSKVYLPLWLGEADVYEVYSPAMLLMRIAERLVEEVPGTKLGEALPSLEGTGDEDSLFEELAAHLTEEAERQKRTLLVLMENLDALFESFAPKQRTAQTRQLRSLLLDNRSLLFISTTPTRYLKELSDPKAPLFAQLKERRLNQLKVDEVGALFTKLSQMTGRKELLGAGPDAALKQRIIHQLTGGLPRSVVMAFEILRDKEGIQALVEDLRTFLDAQTAYFEARLSRLAPRERSIVTTLALAEQNLTLREIAAKSRLPEKSLSTLVARLEQEGYVETIEGTGGKGTLYGLSEGLFRIWYQYRKGRLLLEPLVRFLAYWYEPTELEVVIGAMQQRLNHDGPTAGRAAQLAFIQVHAAFVLATSEHGRLERQRIWEECRRAVEEDAASETNPPLDPALRRALAAVIGHMFSGRSDEGQAALDKALAPHEPLSESLASGVTSYLLYQVLDDSKKRGLRHPEAFQLIATRFEGSSHSSARHRAAIAWIGVIECLCNLGRYEEALSRADALLYHSEWREAPASKVVLLMTAAARLEILSELGRHEDVVVFGKELLDEMRDQSFQESVGLSHQVLACVSKSLKSLGRDDEQELVLEKLAGKWTSQSPSIARRLSATAALDLHVLRARKGGEINLGKALDDLDRYFDEYRDVMLSLPDKEIGVLISVYAELVRRSGQEHPVPNAIRGVFLALLGQDVVKAGALFLGSPGPFLRLFQLNDLGEWIRQMLEADLHIEQKQQLRLHLRLVELLDAVTTKAPGARARLRQQLGRVPSELRELYESLVSKLSKVS